MPSRRSRVVIRSYKAGSKSARALADYLGIRVLKQEGSKFVSRENDVVISWGNSSSFGSNLRLGKVINKPTSVSGATNKLYSFNALEAEGISIPRYDTNQITAKRDFKEYLYASH